MQLLYLFGGIFLVVIGARIQCEGPAGDDLETDYSRQVRHVIVKIHGSLVDVISGCFFPSVCF